MRNKGFFWFLTILLTVICIYQLSFTWVSNSVEKKAEKEAKAEVAAMIEESKATGGLINNYDFNNPEEKEIAIADVINKKLKAKADQIVYPVIGSSFKETKSRSLAFGLDLVGGMSVTLEISIPDLVKNYAKDYKKNEKSPEFMKVYNVAYEKYKDGQGNFIDLFVEAHNSKGKGKLIDYFSYAKIEELNIKSSNDEVVEFLKKMEESSMVGVEEIMNRRINQFGVAQPNIQKDEQLNRLYIELPGVQDEATVAAKLKSTANLEFYETYELSEIQGPLTQAIEISKTPQKKVEEVVEDDAKTLENDSTTVDDSLTVETPEEELSLSDLSGDGEKETGLASARSWGKGQLFVDLKQKGNVTQQLKRSDVRGVLPDNLRLLWGEEIVEYGDTKEKGYLLYAIKVPLDKIAKVGGKHIKSASDGYDTESGKITVNLVMNEEGSAKWAQMTAANVDRQVAITMDSIVYSAPNVENAISGGTTQISGSFSIEEAKGLAGLLNAGALPAPCIIIEQTKVGPTIGAENSRAGLMSFGFALLLVFAYMIFYYGKAGIVADIALFANILFIFGSLASFGAVLTLAGIAGIVLTIGMAVDANVLIFERIREEQTAGKDLKSAIDTGFKKALTSIIDANVTTLLTAIVLKSFGSGPIESFATTLIIGIFTSVFAALVITRLCIGWWMKKGKTINFESKITKGAFKNFNFDFVNKRKVFYTVSAVLIVGAIAALSTKGLSSSVEFSGGRSYGVKFEKEVGSKIEQIKSNLDKVLVDNGKVASTSLKTKDNNYYLEITTNFMRSQNDSTEYVKAKIEEGLALSKAEVGAATFEETRTVSPTVSEELMTSSMIAIILSLVIIFGYILMRFGKWQYSTGAIIAMAHDVTIVLGIFALLHGILPFNMDIDQAFIAAILTVIGYSINDTVIVFDRIRENLRLHKNSDENKQINISLNSTLSRTINTSMTTFIVLLIIFLFGGAAIKGFVFALMIGVIVGTYSSVCIATPILIDFSKKSKKGLHEPEVQKPEVAEA